MDVSREKLRSHSVLEQRATASAGWVTAPGAKPEMRLHYLDGVRGWASLAVLIFHASWEFLGAIEPGFRTSKLALLNDGPLAVYIFFVLSGFVLSHGFVETGNLTGLRKKAIQRYTRLTIPILGTSLAAFVLMRGGLLFNHEANAFLNRPDWLDLFYRQPPHLWDALSFALYKVYFEYTLDTSYDVFLWTMPIELSGSFLIFGILALSSRSGWDFYAWVGAALLFCWRYQPLLICFVYGLVLARLSLRADLARLGNSRAGDILALAPLAAVIACSIMQRGRPGLHLWPVVAALFVTVPMLSRTARMVFETRLSRFLGEISFPLYLTHSLVICSAGSYLVLAMHDRGYGTDVLAWTVLAVVLVTSIAAGTLFVPVEHLAKTVSRRLSAYLLDEAPARPREERVSASSVRTG
jgi:peptidoglycan/LPS O-acetylase OafA/YrhL